MGINCQHCGTRYIEFPGHEGFCCSGCAQVYALIQAEGMGDYYALQDRVGKSPAADLEQLESLSWADASQAAAEKESGKAPRLVLSLRGMTCVGCAWLVEKVSRGQPGVVSTRVNLEQNTVVISWIPELFYLRELVVDLGRFGYLATAYEGVSSARYSPLLWRLCLCLLFTTNGFLLAAVAPYTSDASDYVAILSLLEWFFAGLSVLVGATFFILPAYQSLRRSRLHYDALTAVGIIIVIISSVLGDSEFWHLSLMLTALLTIRWIHRWQWGRMKLSADNVEPKVLSLLQFISAVILIVGVCSLYTYGLDVVVAVLLASSLYPLAQSVSYSPPVLYVSATLICALVGVLLGYMFASIPLALLYLAGAGASCNFLFFCLRRFCSKHPSV